MLELPALLLLISPISPALQAPADNIAIAAWGDSLTAGNEDRTGTAYPQVLSKITGRATYNGGVGGQTSTQIASRMLAGSSYWESFTIIWAGRNNASQQSTVLADIASMIAVLPRPQRSLILAIPNGEYPGELAGGVAYNTIIADNKQLEAAYLKNYLDVRSYLVSQYNTADKLDVYDHANDVWPSSLRVSWAGTLLSTLSPASCDFSFTLAGSSGYSGGQSTILVDGEYIKITSLKGTAPGPYAVSGCTRGFAGSQPAPHQNGAPMTSWDPLHLNAAGYTKLAAYIADILTSRAPELRQ